MILREKVKDAILDRANAWAAGEGCDELLEQSYGYALADAALAAIEAPGAVSDSLREQIGRAIVDAWHAPIARWNAAADLPPHRRAPWDSEAPIYLPIADAALAAIEAAGCAIVPIEPTEEMQAAGAYPRENRKPVADIYRAMLAARPKSEPGASDG